MKVRNLVDYPVQLGDGRVIGASGTPEAVREYRAATLADSDKERERRGLLQVVKETPTVAASGSAEDKTTKRENNK